MKHVIAISIFASLAFSACTKRQSAWDTTTTTDSQEAQAGWQLDEATYDTLTAEADAAWAQRDNKEHLVKAIEAWNRLSKAEPNNAARLVQISRANYLLADSYLSVNEADEAKAIETFEAGIDAAERALIIISPDFASRMRAGTRVEDALPLLTKEAVPALYWRSSNMGKWSLKKGFETILAHKDQVRAVMERCLELDPTYFHGGPHRYFGAMYARLPSFAGRDLDKSFKHFQEALRIAPYYLGTHSIIAEFHSTQKQDRAAYDTHLKAVMDGDTELNADVAPENRLEKVRAQRLMKQADDFFE